MADTKISALTDGVTANATDRLGGARNPFGSTDNVYVTPSYIRTYLLGLANIWAATQTITPAVNTNALAVTGYSLTGSNASSLIDLAGTWNTSGTPTAIKLAVTNTASNGNSLLMNLLVDAASVFKVGLTGIAAISGNEASLAMVRSFTSHCGFVPSTISGFNPAIKAGSAIPIGFNSATDVNSGDFDAVWWRDAAGVIAQRNAANAQEHRWYNTFTDASNYERMSLAWSSNVAILKPQNAGSGSARLFVPVTGSTVIGSLPSASTMGAGARSFVTDALTPVFGSAASAGGSAKVPVVSDGTSWLVG